VFVKCYWAIPERFRGEKLGRIARIGNHMLRVTYQRFTIRGEYEIPDWWVDSAMAWGRA
jgi:hypothetical protein